MWEEPTGGGNGASLVDSHAHTRRFPPRRRELALLLGRERVLDLNQQGHVGALHLPFHSQHLVHLRQCRRRIDARLLEQRGEPLRLVLHAPLKIHHFGLKILNRFRDDRTLLGAERDVLLVLHHQLRRKQQPRQRVVGLRRLGREGRLLGRRGAGEQGEGGNECERERFHGVLRSKVMVTRPSCGTVRSRSSFGSASRKSVGVFRRTVARSLGSPCRITRTATATLATMIPATANPSSRRRDVVTGRARAAASVAWNAGAIAASSRRSAWKRSPRS